VFPGLVLAVAGPFGKTLVSWFRSSQYHRYRSRSEHRNRNDTRINSLLVSFDSEIRPEPDIEIEIVRISESGH